MYLKEKPNSQRQNIETWKLIRQPKTKETTEQRIRENSRKK